MTASDGIFDRARELGIVASLVAEPQLRADRVDAESEALV